MFGKIYKPLARHIKERGAKTQITNMRSERGDIITNFIELKIIIRRYYE